jgi:chorismate mutase
MSSQKKRQDSRKYDELQELLKQEINLCHEILSQMSQQEYLMLIGELEMRMQLDMDLKPLVKQFNTLEKKRNILTEELLHLAPLHSTLADLLDPIDETDVETMILLEKHQTLVKKIADQKERNNSLQKMIQKEGTLDPMSPVLRSHMIYDSKSQKPLLITIDYPNKMN